MADAENGGGVNLRKWVLGIVGAVITSVLVKQFTAPDDHERPTDSAPYGTPANSPASDPPSVSPTYAADVRIMDLPKFMIGSAREGRSQTVTVYNGGTAAADGCQIEVDDESAGRITTSGGFGVPPGGSTTVTLTINLDGRVMADSVGSVNATATVSCRDTQSPVYRVHILSME